MAGSQMQTKRNRLEKIFHEYTEIFWKTVNHKRKTDKGERNFPFLSRLRSIFTDNIVQF